MILDDILVTKRQEVAALHEVASQLRKQAEQAPPCRDFLAALKQPKRRLAIMAEVKKASPSKGLIRADFHPPAIAKAYEAGGADAISVLTDQTYFQGRLQDLTDVKNAVDIPVFRKDFIIDPLQIFEARAAGADALLLIARILAPQELAQLYRLATELGMGVLIEVHDEEEVARVLPLEPAIIGINNRDLHTFRADIQTTARLLPHIPPGTLVISESGISKPEDIRWLAELGVHGVLVGEHLMRQSDVAAAVRELMDVS
ncbi:MAG: indole-3-glycerol phosphate synthase [Bacillaceae bacterium G1]|nr:indole-3-glycerol phosphate synthase TrpC [Bacillota bacterium]OJF18116.1 MAG: indole-3-glycerol phosphate synthase [Bacillaceae bacterium G1]